MLGSAAAFDDDFRCEVMDRWFLEEVLLERAMVTSAGDVRGGMKEMPSKERYCRFSSSTDAVLEKRMNPFRFQALEFPGYVRSTFVPLAMKEQKPLAKGYVEKTTVFLT